MLKLKNTLLLTASLLLLPCFAAHAVTPSSISLQSGCYDQTSGATTPLFSISNNSIVMDSAYQSKFQNIAFIVDDKAGTPDSDHWLPTTYDSTDSIPLDDLKLNAKNGVITPVLTTTQGDTELCSAIAPLTNLTVEVTKADAPSRLATKKQSNSFFSRLFGSFLHLFGFRGTHHSLATTPPPAPEPLKGVDFTVACTDANGNQVKMNAYNKETASASGLINVLTNPAPITCTATANDGSYKPATTKQIQIDQNYNPGKDAVKNITETVTPTAKHLHVPIFKITNFTAFSIIYAKIDGGDNYQPIDSNDKYYVCDSVIQNTPCSSGNSDKTASDNPASIDFFVIKNNSTLQTDSAKKSVSMTEGFIDNKESVNYSWQDDNNPANIEIKTNTAADPTKNVVLNIKKNEEVINTPTISFNFSTASNKAIEAASKTPLQLNSILAKSSDAYTGTINLKYYPELSSDDKLNINITSTSPQLNPSPNSISLSKIESTPIQITAGGAGQNTSFTLPLVSNGTNSAIDTRNTGHVYAIDGSTSYFLCDGGVLNTKYCPPPKDPSPSVTLYTLSYQSGEPNLETLILNKTSVKKQLSWVPSALTSHTMSVTENGMPVSGIKLGYTLSLEADSHSNSLNTQNSGNGKNYADSKNKNLTVYSSKDASSVTYQIPDQSVVPSQGTPNTGTVTMYNKDSNPTVSYGNVTGTDSLGNRVTGSIAGNQISLTSTGKTTTPATLTFSPNIRSTGTDTNQDNSDEATTYLIAKVIPSTTSHYYGDATPQFFYYGSDELSNLKSSGLILCHDEKDTPKLDIYNASASSVSDECDNSQSSDAQDGKDTPIIDGSKYLISLLQVSTIPFQNSKIKRTAIYKQYNSKQASSDIGMIVYPMLQDKQVTADGSDTAKVDAAPEAILKTQSCDKEPNMNQLKINYTPVNYVSGAQKLYGSFTSDELSLQGNKSSFTPSYSGTKTQTQTLPFCGCVANAPGQNDSGACSSKTGDLANLLSTYIESNTSAPDPDADLPLNNLLTLENTSQSDSKPYITYNNAKTSDSKSYLNLSRVFADTNSQSNISATIQYPNIPTMSNVTISSSLIPANGTATITIQGDNINPDDPVTVKLQPTDDISSHITLQNSNVTLNDNKPVSVLVTATNQDQKQYSGSIMLSSDNMYIPSGHNSIAVSVNSADKPSISVIPSSINISSSNPKPTFTINADNIPSSGVTLKLKSSADGLNFKSSETLKAGQSQVSVPVSAEADATGTQQITITDGQGLQASVNVTVTPAPKPSINVDNTNITLTNDTRKKTFTIRGSNIPDSGVNLNLSDVNKDIIINPSNFTLTKDNESGQVVTVTAKEDAQTSNSTITISGGDLPAATVTVDNQIAPPKPPAPPKPTPPAPTITLSKDTLDLQAGKDYSHFTIKGNNIPADGLVLTLTPTDPDIVIDDNKTVTLTTDKKTSDDITAHANLGAKENSTITITDSTGKTYSPSVKVNVSQPTPPTPSPIINVPKSIDITQGGSTSLTISGQNIPDGGLPLTLESSDSTNIKLDGTNPYTLPAKGELKITVTASPDADGNPTISIKDSNDKTYTVQVNVSKEPTPATSDDIDENSIDTPSGTSGGQKSITPSDDPITSYFTITPKSTATFPLRVWLVSGTNFGNLPKNPPVTFYSDQEMQDRITDLVFSSAEKQKVYVKKADQYTTQCANTSCYIYIASVPASKTPDSSNPTINLANIKLI